MKNSKKLKEEQMDTNIDNMAKIIGEGFEAITDDNSKGSKTFLPLKTRKVKPKNKRQDEVHVFQFMEKAQALGFSFEERQKLFLLYGGHL